MNLKNNEQFTKTKKKKPFLLIKQLLIIMFFLKSFLVVGDVL